MEVIMPKKKEDMCPLFPDVPCPQGKNIADACKVRMDSGYDPVTDFKDYLFMNCAIHRAHENEDKEK